MKTIFYLFIGIVLLSIPCFLFFRNMNKEIKYSEIKDFDRPFSITKDEKGKLYVCDFGPQQVKIYDSKHQFLKTIGEAGSGNGQFNMPHAVDFDDDGNIYVTDYGNKRVQKFTKAGEFISLISDPRLVGPATSYFDKNYNLYVSDFGSGSVQKYSKDFDYLGLIGAKSDGSLTSGWDKEAVPAISAEPGGFERVHSARVDKDGTIYIVDSANNRIQRFSNDGKFTGWIGAKAEGGMTNGWQMQGLSTQATSPGGFSTPIALDFAGDDEIAVLEYANPRVQRFSKKDGKFIGWFGQKESGEITNGWEKEGVAKVGSKLGAINLAYDLKVYNNKIYIADTGNHRVQIIEFNKNF